jgi:hypothetical protein
MTTSWYNRSSRVWTSIDYKVRSWTTATRPTVLENGLRGTNTDFNGEETWNGQGWLVLNGRWATGAQPTGVLSGSRGFNIDTNMGEQLDGNGEWVIE